MKIFVLPTALALLRSVACADPLERVWQTEVGDGPCAHITIHPVRRRFAV